MNDGTNRRLVTSRTVQLFKTLVGQAKWRTAAQLMMLLKGLGRELHAAGGFREPAIGNVVRRIMSCVREEVATQAAAHEEEERTIKAVALRLAVSSLSNAPGSSATAGASPLSPHHHHHTKKTSATASVVSFAEGTRSEPSSQKMPRNLSLASMLWAHPQHVTVKRTGIGAKMGGKMRTDSFSSDPGVCPSFITVTAVSASENLPDVFHVIRPELRQSIMEAIQEIVNELEDLHKNINDQATSHIHADEVILTYARSKTIELVRFKDV